MRACGSAQGTGSDNVQSDQTNKHYSANDVYAQERPRDVLDAIAADLQLVAELTGVRVATVVDTATDGAQHPSIISVSS